MCVFRQLMYSLRWNHAVTVKTVLSRVDTFLYMKSRNHLQYWWRFPVSDGLSSYTTFTQNTQHFKQFTALCVDPCCEKCQTGFWRNRFQHSNSVTAHYTRSNLTNLQLTSPRLLTCRATYTCFWKARQQNRYISQTEKSQPLSTGTFQTQHTLHYTLVHIR